MALCALLRHSWFLGLLFVAACGQSGEEGVLPPERPPAAPTGLAAIADDASVHLSWSPVSRADGYFVYYATAPGIKLAAAARLAVPGAGSAKLTVPGLANDVLYYFVVTAANAAGESPPSAEISAMPQDIEDLPSGNFGLWAVDDPTKFRYDQVEGILSTVPASGTAAPSGFARLHSSAIDGTWSFDFRFENVGPAAAMTVTYASKTASTLTSFAPLSPAYGITIRSTGALDRISPGVTTQQATWNPDTAWHRARIVRGTDGTQTWFLDGAQVATFKDTGVTRSDYFVVANTNNGVKAHVRRVQRPEDHGPWAVDLPAKFLYDAGSGILSTVPDTGSSRPSAFARLPTRATTGEWKIDYRFPTTPPAGTSTALEVFIMGDRSSSYVPASPRYRFQLGSDGTVALDRTDASGLVTSLGQFARAPDTAWHALAFSRTAAGQLAVKVDGATLFAAADTTVSSGSFFTVGNTDFGIVAEVRRPQVPGSYGNWQIDRPEFFVFDGDKLVLETIATSSVEGRARLRSPAITGTWAYDLQFLNTVTGNLDVTFVSRNSGSLTSYAIASPIYQYEISSVGRLELFGAEASGNPRPTSTWISNTDWNSARIERNDTGRITCYLNEAGVLADTDPSVTRSDVFVVNNTTNGCVARIRHVQLPGDFGPWSLDDPSRFRYDAASGALITVPRLDGLSPNAYARLPSTAAYGVWEFEFRFPDLDNVRPVPRTVFGVDYIARATTSASSYAPGAPSYGVSVWTDGVLELRGMGNTGAPATTPQATWIPDGAWHKLRVERSTGGVHTWYLDGTRKLIFREATGTASEFFVVGGTNNGVVAQFRNARIQ